jgi:cytoskeletal protein CcmA (bactofilin family)
MLHRSRATVALIAGIALAAMAVSVAVGQTGRPADKLRSGQNVVIPAGETVDHDLYVFGANVTMSGTIHGDLVVAGGTVVIDGTVDGDLLAAASTLTVSGSVGGDARIAAATATISGKVGEDTAVVSNSLTLTANGQIGQDLLFATSDTILDGNVTGGISGSATQYARRGSVGGSESVSLARRQGEPATDRTLSLALDALRQFIIVVAFGLLGLLFLPRGTRAASAVLRSRPLPALGVGVLALVGYIVAIVLLFIAVFLSAFVLGILGFEGLAGIDLFGGVIAALALVLAFVIFAAFVGDAIVGLALGRLIATPESSRWADVLRLVVGSAIVVLVTSFPGIGDGAKLLVVLAALGAVSLAFVEWRQRPISAAPAPPPAPAD